MCTKSQLKRLNKCNLNSLARLSDARWRSLAASPLCLDGILNIYQHSWSSAVDNSIDVVNSRVRSDSVVIMANIMALERCHGWSAEASHGSSLCLPEGLWPRLTAKLKHLTWAARWGAQFLLYIHFIAIKVGHKSLSYRPG